MNSISGQVGPLVRALFSYPPIEDTLGVLSCPMCDCGHQVFVGAGFLCPDKTGTQLICAYPSTETILKIDIPPDVNIKGLSSYVRYACQCGGHAWALVTTYHKDQTVSWCVDMTPPDKQDESLLPPPPPITKEALDEPLTALPHTVNYAWHSWGSSNLPLQPLASGMPKLAATYAADGQPPHLAVGTNDNNLMAMAQHWLFALSVDIPKEAKEVIHTFLYWGKLLIVVTGVKKSLRKGLAEVISRSIISMDTLKPDLYIMSKRQYSVLVQRKAQEAAKPT